MTTESIKSVYCGVIVPMVTPLLSDYTLDESSARQMIRSVVAHQCAPFVCSTTGEAASIADREKANLVKLSVEEASGKQLVYAGIADNCLASSIEKAVQYHEFGAKVAVAHLPCYYPIDTQQMETYFLSLADACPLPLMLYNIPVTTGHSISVELLDKLSHHSNIVGVKDSERGDDRLAECLKLWRDRHDFTFHLGWAAMSSFGLRNGLDGIVPSSANLVPGLYSRLYDAAKQGETEEAEEFQMITDEISAFYQKDLTLSRSIPRFKAMLSAFDLAQPHSAPPMQTLSGGELDAVRADAHSRFSRYL